MISVISITFNNYEELIGTCSSLDEQECEHIVVNGGQCKKTKSFLESKEFKGKYISESDNGISDAFNKGANLATQKYITFLNSGDYLIDSNYFEKAINLLEQDVRLKAVSTNMEITKGDYSYIRKAFNKLPNCPFNHPGFVMRTQDMKDLGFKEEFKVAMDFDLFIRLTMLNFDTVALCDNVAVRMTGGGVSQVRTDLGALEKIKSLKSLSLLRGKLKYILYWQYFKGRIKQIILNFSS